MISKIKGIEYNPPRTVGNISFSSGTTLEVVVNELLIPGGTLKQNDLLGIDTRLRKVGTAGTVFIRIRIGGTINTSQSLVALYISTSSAHTLIPIMRRLSINNLTNSTYHPLAVTTNAWDFSGPPIFWENNTSINWANNQYIIVTAQGSATDGFNCPYIITDFIQGS